MFGNFVATIRFLRVVFVLPIEIDVKHFLMCIFRRMRKSGPKDASRES